MWLSRVVAPRLAITTWERAPTGNCNGHERVTPLGASAPRATRREFLWELTLGTSPVASLSGSPQEKFVRARRAGSRRCARRDPFVSLLLTNELRPTMSDLRLTGILFDPNGHSVATLRDIGTNTQYRVATGSVLGRMRVSSIRLKTVVFTIDEFGMNRQDSLVLGDSTKVRAK